LVLRGRILVTGTEGQTNVAVPQRLGMKLPTVGEWDKRSADICLGGQRDIA